jgi:hypothetical protein
MKEKRAQEALSLPDERNLHVNATTASGKS